MSYHEFVGKLFGIAVCSQSPLALCFPSILWKKMVGEQVDRSDLGAIDVTCLNCLDTMRNIEDSSEYNFIALLFG